MLCDAGIFPFKATFSADRMVNFANGAKGASAIATAIPRGSTILQEFWFINLMTPKQHDMLLFVGPLGYYSTNKAAMDEYLATIETTGK